MTVCLAIIHQNFLTQGGGDSSETESAPPADDDDEIMEDLRFCNEFMSKQQGQTPQNDGNNADDDFSLKLSGDEGNLSVCLIVKSILLSVCCPINSIYGS